MTFVEKVCKRLRDFAVPYALVGGYAVALHGAPRGTIDIDIVISLKEESLVAAQGALESIGLRSLLPINAHDLFRFRREYIEKRNLVAWSFYNPSDPMEVVDIIVTHDFDDCTAIKVRLATSEISVMAKTDLIKMKKQSGRPQDLLDIEALKKL